MDRQLGLQLGLPARSAASRADRRPEPEKWCFRRT
jgi:hypothetical protein